MKLLERLLICALLIGVCSAQAQSGFTTVTATVKDPAGALYTNAAWTAALIDATDLPRFIGAPPGSPPAPSSAVGFTDSFGLLTTSLVDNNLILPVGTHWKFHVTNQAKTVAFFCTVTITGASQDITSLLQACAALLSVPISTAYVNTPMVGSAAPMLLGDSVFPGSASGFCTNPAFSPAVQKFTPASPNASTIAAETLYFVYELGNRNGRTLKSAQSSIAVGAGEAVQVGWNITEGDHAFLSGCYKMRVLVSNVNGGPYYAWTPWTRKINLATITRATNVVTATTSGQHGLVPLDVVTIVGVTCGGGGACTNSFNGTFTLDEGSVDPVTGTSTLKWTQSGANESGDAAVGQVQDNNQTIDGDWHIATSLYGNRGAVFNTPIPTSGTTTATANTAVIDPIQVAANLVRSLNTVADPLYYKGPQYRLKLQAGYSATLTTPLTCALMRIEGVGITNLQGSHTTPKILSQWDDYEAATLMVMGPGCQTEGVVFESTLRKTPSIMFTQGMHTLNGLDFNRTVFLASGDPSTTNGAIRFRATPISFAAMFRNGNVVGGRWNVWGDRSILANTLFQNWRFNCGAWDGSGAIKMLGGPDNPDRANGDGDGITSAYFTLENSVTESCRGKQVHGNALTLHLRGTSSIADPATQPGTEAMGKWETSFWTNGGSVGNALILEPGTSFTGTANAAVTIKQVLNGGGSGMLIKGYSGSITSSGASYVGGFDGGGGNFLFQTFGGGAGTSGFTCDMNETSTAVQAGKITNASPTNNSTNSTCFNMGDPATNTQNANNLISGVTAFTPPSGAGVSTTTKYLGIPKNQSDFLFYPSWGWLNTAKTAFRLGGSDSAGLNLIGYKTDGSTILFQVNANTSNPYLRIGGSMANISANSSNYANNWPLRFVNAADSGNSIMVNMNASDQGILCNVTAGCKIGPDANTALLKGILTGTASLNFASITAPNCAADLTITVTGAADGDTVFLGVPNGSQAAGVQFDAWVSSANTVSVRACAYTGTPDPASGTFRATVFKF